jgi:hypothetical protein
MRPTRTVKESTIATTMTSLRLSGACRAYAVRMAGPAAAATNTSEMARRFRTAVVSMERPRVIGVGRPHAPDLFRDDGVKCFKHTLRARTPRTAVRLGCELFLWAPSAVIDDPESETENDGSSTAHQVLRVRALNAAGASCPTRRRTTAGFARIGGKMLKVSPKLLAIAATAAFAVLASVSAPSPAQAASGRQGMAQCVSRVLSQLARRRAPESRVGHAVLSRCDRQLRASLAQSIRTGEAPNCTVESCIDVARNRAVAEAIGAYRQMGRRGR